MTYEYFACGGAHRTRDTWIDFSSGNVIKQCHDFCLQSGHKYFGMHCPKNLANGNPRGVECLCSNMGYQGKTPDSWCSGDKKTTRCDGPSTITYDGIQYKLGGEHNSAYYKTNLPVDCGYNWSDWSDCTKTCGGGTQERSLTIHTQPQHSGNACPANSVETKACNTNPCPVDCGYNWSNWSDCTETCGGGTQERTLTIHTQPQHGGNTCPANSVETKACNTNPCPVSSVASDVAGVAQTTPSSQTTPPYTFSDTINDAININTENKQIALNLSVLILILFIIILLIVR